MTKNNTTMPSLPPMPRNGRKDKPVVACQCGCGMGTKGTWYPGHDGRATGWAIRIEKGLLSLDDVPSNERQGAIVMLKRRADAAGRSIEILEPKADRKAKRVRKVKVAEVEVQVEQPTEAVA